MSSGAFNDAVTEVTRVGAVGSSRSKAHAQTPRNGHVVDSNSTSISGQDVSQVVDDLATSPMSSHSKAWIRWAPASAASVVRLCKGLASKTHEARAPARHASDIFGPSGRVGSCQLRTPPTFENSRIGQGENRGNLNVTTALKTLDRTCLELAGLRK